MTESEVRDEVCDFDNLYRAMQHCKNNVMWKDSVAGYVKNGLVMQAQIAKANSDIEYLAMMTDIEMEQEEDEQEVQDHGEEE